MLPPEWGLCTPPTLPISGLGGCPVTLADEDLGSGSLVDLSISMKQFWETQTHPTPSRIHSLVIDFGNPAEQELRKTRWSFWRLWCHVHEGEPVHWKVSQLSGQGPPSH